MPENADKRGAFAPVGGRRFLLIYALFSCVKAETLTHERSPQRAGLMAAILADDGGGDEHHGNSGGAYIVGID